MHTRGSSRRYSSKKRSVVPMKSSIHRKSRKSRLSSDTVKPPMKVGTLRRIPNRRRKSVVPMKSSIHEESLTPRFSSDTVKPMKEDIVPGQKSMNGNNVRDTWKNFNLEQELYDNDTDFNRINNNDFVKSVKESAEFIHLTDYIHTNKNDYLFSSAVVNNKKLQELNTGDAIIWLKDDFKAHYIEINENPQQNNSIITYIIYLIKVANSEYENLIKSIDVKLDTRRVIKPFSLGEVKDAFTKYIRAIKMIRESNNMIISHNKPNANKLLGPYIEVGNLCLNSIAYYIIRTIQRNNSDLFNIAIKGGVGPEHDESDILIILVLRILIKSK